MGRLKEIREKAGLSQEKLALMAGVHWRSIQNWERDPSRAIVRDIKKVADALECGIDDILEEPRCS